MSTSSRQVNGVTVVDLCGSITMEGGSAELRKTLQGLAQQGSRKLVLNFAEVTEVAGKVRGKVAIIGDDLTTTGGTLIAGADALRDHGATDVWVFVTQALIAREGPEALGNAGLAGIVTTDTAPTDPLAMTANMTVLTVAPLLAETIMNVFADDSVSAIFGGENQLF